MNDYQMLFPWTLPKKQQKKGTASVPFLQIFRPCYFMATASALSGITTVRPSTFHICIPPR